jgi:hypothetical protein
VKYDPGWIEQYDAAGREKNTEIREKRAAVQAIVPQGLAGPEKEKAT